VIVREKEKNLVKVMAGLEMDLVSKYVHILNSLNKNE
jgi:hypothetical protein